MYTWWFPESSGGPYGGDVFSADPSLNPNDSDFTGDQMP